MYVARRIVFYYLGLWEVEEWNCKIFSLNAIYVNLLHQRYNLIGSGQEGGGGLEVTGELIDITHISIITGAGHWLSWISDLKKN